MQSRNAVRCRSSNSLTSRVRQNSPRTRLLASNRVMLRQRHCAALFWPKARKTRHFGSTQGLSVAAAQGFRASTGVCRRPYVRKECPNVPRHDLRLRIHSWNRRSGCGQQSYPAIPCQHRASHQQTGTPPPHYPSFPLFLPWDTSLNLRPVQ